MLTKKILALVIAAPFFVLAPSLIVSVPHAYAETTVETSAIDLVEKLGKEVVELLSKSDLSESDKKTGFTKIIARDFNMPLIGRFVLGKHWRKSSTDQQAEFQELFQEYIITTYQKRIGDYSGENLKIVKARALNKKEVLVNSHILRPQGPPIKLGWRVRKSKDGDQKIIDLIVENVSMALTHREEFSAVVSKNGGDVEALLEKLRSHIAKATN
ncbi:MAG: ABC transporter substrate-binding protein [Sneathiella sp.]|nr:ABC transporter substrate-binding protein [Sneathiella sp.]